MFSNTAKKKGSIVTGQHPPWWPITQFSSLNRSDSKKSKRLHQQFNTGPYVRNATVCNLPCQDKNKDKWHISFQDVCFPFGQFPTDICFPFGQIPTTPLHLHVPHYLCRWAVTPRSLPAPRDNRHATTRGPRDQPNPTAFLDCLLPVCSFFRHRLEYGAQNIAKGFFSGSNKEREFMISVPCGVSFCAFNPRCSGEAVIPSKISKVFSCLSPLLMILGSFLRETVNESFFSLSNFHSLY